MSSDQYPDVGANESAIVPQQDETPREWPKKIRTLTASELDRLTIDSKGRFYWDGKLVNYEPPQSDKSADPNNPSTMDALDRAAHDLSRLHSPDAANPDGQLAEFASVPAVPVAFPERVRIKLTAWQSLGVAVVVLCVLVGTLGVAAFGLVNALDWGCRNRLILQYCPAVPEPRPPQRLDIPA